uniref:Uncharacterized protein n=1 Tax=Anguilla anguilla TaxID=7936 RepID=A0A0E9R985_ANGAN
MTDRQLVTAVLSECWVFVSLAWGMSLNYRQLCS